MNLRRVALLLAIPLAACLALPAGASILSVVNQGAIVAAPGSVLDDATFTTEVTGGYIQWGFDEMQGVNLAAPLGVDGGNIGPNIVVNSHMIFHNTQGDAQSLTVATWTFDGVILGVMSDNDGVLEAASSTLLGNLLTTYPAASQNNRGLEGTDALGYAGNVLTLRSLVTEPGDWIRVVTSAEPIPEPGTLLLLGAGLAGAAAARRRRRS